jgi:hypothetical protein
MGTVKHIEIDAVDKDAIRYGDDKTTRWMKWLNRRVTPVAVALIVFLGVASLRMRQLTENDLSGQAVRLSATAERFYGTYGMKDENGIEQLEIRWVQPHLSSGTLVKMEVHVMARDGMQYPPYTMSDNFPAGGTDASIRFNLPDLPGFNPAVPMNVYIRYTIENSLGQKETRFLDTTSWFSAKQYQGDG